MPAPSIRSRLFSPTESQPFGRSKAKADPAVAASRRLNDSRRALLKEIDNAHFSWFHVKVALVSGAGFFTDAYDIFAINIVSVMLGYLYEGGTDGTLAALPRRALTTSQEVGIKIATPVGVLLGQLLFGWLGDKLGRKRIYGVELLIIMVATFAQALCAPAVGISFVGVIIFWRFVMGIGIGGDYPISAVISSEFSSVHIRGRVMAAVFANQGWGQLTATLLSFVVVSAYKHSFLEDTSPEVFRSLDRIWRLIIGCGCVPAAIALYFRLTIPETPRFTMDIERNLKQATLDTATFLSSDEGYTVDPDALAQRVRARQATKDDFRSYFAKWENMKVLIGTAYSWFALDIAFYGLGLNSSIILGAIGFGPPSPSKNPGAVVWQTLRNLSLGNLILSVAGLVPGYWATFFFIDRWGRKPIQFMGFSALTVLFVVMGFAYNKLTATSGGRIGFVVLYCFANFFQNFGPNSVTFIVPGEVFPTRYRATAHGISAASGKFGAVVAQLAFQWLKDVGGTNKFLPHILEIFAFFMLTGLLSTTLIPETAQKSLEVLSNESQDDFIQGSPASPFPSPVPTPSPEGSVVGYVGEFQMSPIKLHPITHLPARPVPTFAPAHKPRSRSDMSHFASLSDLSMSSTQLLRDRTPT
ncbi:inorganic phosphate transporter [Epithele typhae]|uniref:inorganic phosphate transporter n=1 Tax=Epithele typhae TaxID=378194 RepID=UPI002008395F|nr:inorganic phosphate transporter [Epithele typhae]KAH9945215.1 inorganic phosphate transporter [Epithele typhae]